MSRASEAAAALAARRRAVLAAATIVVWSLAGIASTHAPWHEVGLFPGAKPIVEVGFDRPEGKVVAGALGFAAFLAGYTLLAAGPFLARPIAGCAAVALFAVGRYLFVMWRARAELLPWLGGDASGALRPAVFAAALASFAALLAAVTALRRRL